MQVHLVAGGGYDCNQWLVVSDGEALLVDTGTGMAVDATLEGLEKHLDDGTDLIGVYLTHEHIDHVGGCAAVLDRWDVPCWAPEPLVEPLRVGDGDVTLGTMFGARVPPIPSVQGVSVGDEVRVGDVAFEVLHTPGHTSAHTSLWHEPSRTLIAGDAVFTDGAFGRVDLPTGSSEEMRETLDRLAGMDVRDLFPGHMDPARGDGAKQIEMAVRNARLML